MSFFLKVEIQLCVSACCLFVCLRSTHPAEDGHQVVFTHGEHINVLDNHHLVVVFIEDGVIQHVCGGRKEIQKLKQSGKMCTDMFP